MIHVKSKDGDTFKDTPYRSHGLTVIREKSLISYTSFKLVDVGEPEAEQKRSTKVMPSPYKAWNIHMVCRVS